MAGIQFALAVTTVTSVVALLLNLLDIHSTSLVCIGYPELSTKEQREKDNKGDDASPSNDGQETQKMPRHLWENCH